MSKKIIKNERTLVVIGILCSLSGCSVMRSYNDEMTKTIDQLSHQQTQQALATLESNNSGSDKDLLYFLEKGQILRLNSQYQDSVSTWLSADDKIKVWEAEAKIRAGAILENLGSVMLNDKVRRYDGHDYEKVMLSTQLAVDYLLQGQWDLARTEIKKTHEREALIEEVRAEETAKLEEENQKRGVNKTFKDLNGYPVETLDAPDVTGLKNGYQSAFSHYLAGFVYEALNEPSLAAPGYRKAVELRPGIPVLEEGLSGLDKRMATHKPNTTDLLIVVESGTAPSLTSITIPLPIIVANLGVVPISFPLLHGDPTQTPQPLQVSLDSSVTAALTPVTSLDAMSRRALRDDMPGIILRGVIRAAAKATSQKALMDQGGAGAIAGVALNVANVVTESADERTWRSLPNTIAVARTSVTPGLHEIDLGTGGSNSKQSIDIKGSHALLVARVIRNQVFWSQPQYTDQMPNYIAPPPPALEKPIVPRHGSQKASKNSKKKSK